MRRIPLLRSLRSCRHAAKSSPTFPKRSTSLMLSPDYSVESTRTRNPRPTRKSRSTCSRRFFPSEELPEWTNEAIHDMLVSFAEELGVKNATLMWPLRIAAAGKLVTPGGAVEICHSWPRGNDPPRQGRHRQTRMISQFCPTLSKDLLKREFLNTSAAFAVLAVLGFCRRNALSRRSAAAARPFCRTA